MLEKAFRVTAKRIRNATYDIASIDLPLGTVSAVMSRAMATRTETLLPLIDPVDIVDMLIECVELLEKPCKKKSRRFCFRRK